MEDVIELRDTDVATCIPNPDEGGDITHKHDRESAAMATNVEDVERGEGDVTERKNSTVNEETSRTNTDENNTIPSVKAVLSVYHLLLQIIGWRSCDCTKCTCMCCECTCRCCQLPERLKVAYSWIWPVILTVILLLSLIVQILLCFERDSIDPNPPVNGTYNIACRDHIITYYVLLDVLLIIAFIYGLYVFKRAEVPQADLTAFSEQAVVSINAEDLKSLNIRLWFLLAFGLIWIIYSFLVNILRAFAHHYFPFNQYIIDLDFVHGDTYSEMSLISRNVIVFVMVLISWFGFIVIDVAFTAVFFNYSIRCELMIYYFRSICTRVKNKEWEIDQAIKEINLASQFLSKLNSHMATATTIMLFILLTSCYNGIFGLEQLRQNEDNVKLIAPAGVFSVIQWSTLFVLPFIQAARVTDSGFEVKKTALKMRSLVEYEDMQRPQVDSFVVYSSNLNLTAELASVPISPALVGGLTFVLGFVLYLTLTIDTADTFTWAPWL